MFSKKRLREIVTDWNVENTMSGDFSSEKKPTLHTAALAIRRTRFCLEIDFDKSRSLVPFVICVCDTVLSDT